MNVYYAQRKRKKTTHIQGRMSEVIQLKPLHWVLVFVALGLVSVAWIVPISVRPDPGTVSPGLGSGSEEYQYLDSPCGCRIPFNYGTTEREVSNAYFNQNGQDLPDPRRLSTFAWAWFQFIDHEITKSESDPEGETKIIAFDENTNMTLTTVLSRVNPANGCLEPKNHLAPMIDGSAVYSDYKDPERLSALRVGPGLCKMKLDDHQLRTCFEEMGSKTMP